MAWQVAAEVIARVILGIIEWIAKAIYIFYTKILPFAIKYIGIPMFIFGCAISGGFAVSFLLLLVGGGVMYFKYIKKMLYINPPIRKVQQPQMYV